MPLNDTFNMSPDKAMEWFNNKGLVESWNWYDLWEEQHATAFTVAKSMQYDILSDIRDAIKQAQGQGLTKRQFRQLLSKKLKAKGWWGRQTVINPKTGKPQIVQLGSAWRLNTIYKTNMQAAMMAGRWRQFKENSKDRPYLQYVAVMDSATRPSHAALNGRIFHVDDPIWQKIWPPNGFGCRCRVRALTAKQAKARGFKEDQSNNLPDGFPDLGFSHNHGIAVSNKFYDSARRYGGAVTKSLNDHITNPIIADQFKQTVEMVLSGSITQDTLLAGFIAPALLAQLNSKSGVIGINAKTINKSKVAPVDLTNLSQLMTKPKAVLIDGDRLIYILNKDDRLIEVIVKSGSVKSVNYIENLIDYGRYELLKGSL